MVQVEEVSEAPVFSAHFEEWLSTVMKGYSQFDKATRDAVEEGMRKLYTNCKFLDTLRTLSGGVVDTKEDFRRLFFLPSVYDMKHYVQIFGSEDPEHYKLKFHASCVFYLCHSNEQELLRQFVLDGGIYSVSKNLEDDNMHARSQFFEVLMRALAIKTPNCEDSSSLWFPTGFDGKKPDPDHDPNEAAFFSNLYDALSHEHLLPSIFAMITVKHDIFPNSLFQCLQLFHFTLNWLQFHYTDKDQRLKLPSSWHNLIKSLREFPDPGIADAAYQWLNMFDCLEKQDDFSNSWLGISKQLRGNKVVPMPAIDESVHKTQQFGVYKKMGNDAFKGKRFTSALPSWEKALEFSQTEKDTAILHSNMAQVFLKLERYSDASSHAQKATVADGQNFKAFYRWAQAEEKLGNVEMAVTKGKAALNVCPDNQEIVEFTERVQEIWER